MGNKNKNGRENKDKKKTRRLSNCDALYHAKHFSSPVFIYSLLCYVPYHMLPKAIHSIQSHTMLIDPFLRCLYFLFPLSSFLFPYSSLHLPLSSLLTPLSTYLFPLILLLSPLTSFLFPYSSLHLPLSSFLTPLSSSLTPLSTYLFPLSLLLFPHSFFSFLLAIY